MSILILIAVKKNSCSFSASFAAKKNQNLQHLYVCRGMTIDDTRPDYGGSRFLWRVSGLLSHNPEENNPNFIWEKSSDISLNCSIALTCTFQLHVRRMSLMLRLKCSTVLKLYLKTSKKGYLKSLPPYVLVNMAIITCLLLFLSRGSGTIIRQNTQCSCYAENSVLIWPSELLGFWTLSIVRNCKY
jgi:hypothetical protein